MVVTTYIVPVVNQNTLSMQYTVVVVVTTKQETFCKSHSFLL
jgi:hypothetical protein